MTGKIIQLTMLGMARPGRRPSTPARYREGVLERTRNAREDARLSLEDIAERLTRASGRPVAADTYRKWESSALLPHDLIIPFCDITGADPYELLTGVPFSLGRRVESKLRSVG